MESRLNDKTKLPAKSGAKPTVSSNQFIVLLPGPFPKGTKFADKEGLLLSLTPGYDCCAWSASGSRRYNSADFMGATLISEAKFRHLLAKLRP